MPGNEKSGSKKRHAATAAANSLGLESFKEKSLGFQVQRNTPAPTRPVSKGSSNAESVKVKTKANQ